MPLTYLTELALRAAVNSNKRELTSGQGQAEAIKEVAIKRSLELIQGSASESTITAQADLQSQAISIAVKVLEIAYLAISKQIHVLNNQRLSFDKERQAGIGTFMVPTNKEETELSVEEKIIKSFLELVFKNPSFSTYLGIHHAEFLTEKGAKFYSTLPFYRISKKLAHPVASKNLLDRARIAINLFFESALPDAIADIETSFQTDYKFIAFWESAFQRKNYLNNRRAPRFIMMCLSNLLWNLQHPVDPKTGLPLNLAHCIALCRDVEIFLNQLLNVESSSCLKKISNSENDLLSFMRKLEIHTKILRAAYAQAQLRELNMDEITNSAHQALRIIDKSMFKLIYKRYDFVAEKKIPNEKAAEILADMVSYLNLLLIRNTELIDEFKLFPVWIPKSAGINKPPRTVMDVLIIFSHLSWRERGHLVARLEKIHIDSSSEFVKTLKKFHLMFVKPIKEISKEELHATVFNPKHQEVSCLTARRLIPLLTLVVRDHQIELDTPNTSNTVKICSSKEQIQFIGLSADSGKGYYQWALSPFVTISTKIAAEVDKLPKRQYRLTQITELLDNISHLVKHYPNFLQNKVFQTFLLTCLNKIKDEYASLDKYIDKVDLYLAHDEHLSRSIQAILRPLTRDLNSSLESFIIASTHLERLVSSPDFTDQQRQLLVTNMQTISEQFTVLFAQDSGITALIDSTSTISTIKKPTTPPNEIAEMHKVFALRELIQNCYDALSYQSREGHKGELLRELLNMAEEKNCFNEGQIKHVIMELTRVTASYRETWLFQAAYGQTRSARALITAIKDPNINSVLPLASIIFEQSDINMLEISDDQILERLKNLREGNLWQESSKKMKLVSLTSSQTQ